MKNSIGIHALVWSGTWNLKDIENSIKLSKQLGYDLIEIPLLDPFNFDIKNTKKYLDKYKFNSVTSLGLSEETDISSSEEQHRINGKKILEKALDVTFELGSDYMGGVLYSALAKYHHPPNKESKKRSAEILHHLSIKAKNYGIKIGLEPVNRYESNLINTAQQAIDFINMADSDNLYVHLDSYHMNIEESDYIQPILLCDDKLGYFHIGENHRGYLGEGHINFPEIKKGFDQIGYKGPVTFESFSSTVVDPKLSNILGVWRNLWTDSYDLAKKSKQFLDDNFK